MYAKALPASALALACVSLASIAPAADWAQFGYDAAHSGNNTAEDAIGRANVAQLVPLYPAPVTLPAIVDGALVYAAGVATPDGNRNLLFGFGTDTSFDSMPATGTVFAMDADTGELLWFSYSKEAPYLRYGVLDAEGRLVHETEVPLPGPRLPHDMAFSEHYAVLNDFPVFWDPALLAQGLHRPRMYRELPSRFAVLPRRGGAADVRWFEASPTYVLHFVNAFERGSEVIVDGFFQKDPMPRPDPADGVGHAGPAEPGVRRRRRARTTVRGARVGRRGARPAAASGSRPSVADRDPSGGGVPAPGRAPRRGRDRRR